MSESSGNENIHLAAVDDSVNDVNGNDRIFGRADKGFLRGGNHMDMLVGGRKHDTLKGGKGDELLRDRCGRDKEIRGGGRDVVTFKPGDDVSNTMDCDAKARRVR